MSAQPAFDTVENRRYLDRATQQWVVKVLPGSQHVSRGEGELLATVLGSCVAACMRDPVAGVGGMNHFMLPHDDDGLWGGVSLSLRYGNHAMEALINELLALGANKHRLECKFFGGGNVLKGTSAIGDQNAEFARKYAQTEGLNVIASDLGGTRGRRVFYNPATGQAWRRLLKRGDEQQVVQSETKMRLAPPLRAKPGNVELF